MPETPCAKNPPPAVKLLKAGLRRRGDQAEQDDHAKRNKRQDRDDLDHREPVFEFAEFLDARGIHA